MALFLECWATFFAWVSLGFGWGFVLGNGDEI